MSFDWTGFFRVAQVLAGENVPYEEEAVLRTAIGRAYYAAYNCAVEYCVNNGRRFNANSGDHELVREHLFALGYDELADSLYRMHRWRKAADYSPVSPNWHIMWLGTSNGAISVIEVTRGTDREA